MYNERIESVNMYLADSVGKDKMEVDVIEAAFALCENIIQKLTEYLKLDG